MDLPTFEPIDPEGWRKLAAERCLEITKLKGFLSESERQHAAKCDQIAAIMDERDHYKLGLESILVSSPENAKVVARSFLNL